MNVSEMKYGLHVATNNVCRAATGTTDFNYRMYPDVIFRQVEL
jgi:hypothetical protein